MSAKGTNTLGWITRHPQVKILYTPALKVQKLPYTNGYSTTERWGFIDPIHLPQTQKVLQQLKKVQAFEVKALLHGQGNDSIDCEVKSVRKGYEKYEVIRNKF